MKKAVFLLLIFIISACSKEKYNTYHFFALGTIVDITIQEKYADYLPEIMNYMNNLADNISNDEKIISQAEINSRIPVSKDLSHILERADFYYNINHKYDPTSYTVSSLYGFPEGPYIIPDEEKINTAKKYAGFSNILLKDNTVIKKSPLLVDFSANAKGYIVDKTLSYMKSKSLDNFIINAGGDLFISGMKNKKYFNTGIINPDNKSKPLSIINITNKAVATSGNYERYFIMNNKYINHIFEGVTFEPVNNYKSVSVIAENTEKADGFSTLFYLLDMNEITNYCKKFDIAVLILTNNNKIVKFCNWEKYEKL